VQNGHQVGPFPEEEFRALVGSSKVTGNTLVWHEGMKEWAAFGSLTAGPNVVSTQPATGNTAARQAAASLISAVDHSVVASHDYEQLRSDLLKEVANEKIKALINSLGRYPYFFPQLFPKIKGLGIKGLIKKKVNTIKAIEPILNQLFLPREEVRFVTTGIFYSFAEQYFMGWMANFINRTAFLFTNYRIIMINVDSKNRPLKMKWHIPYDQIKEFKTGGLSSAVVFKLKDRKTYIFSRVLRPDREDLGEYVKEMIETVDKDNFRIPFYQSRDNLCTNCYLPVEPGNYTCKQCGEEFIKPIKPALMSLFFPCLGNFYLGHKGLGTLELLGYVIFLLAIIGAVVEEGIAALPGVLIAVAVVHILDFALTFHMAKKGIISTKGTWGAHHKSD